MHRFLSCLFCLLWLMPHIATAQQANIAFGGLKQDTGLRVEIQADQLQINQSTGAGLFSGNVQIIQGQMRLNAGQVSVEYDQDGKRIKKLFASRGVTFINGTNIAEAKDAGYDIDNGTITMTGDVLLSQDKNAMSGNNLTINLKNGTGIMRGRVSTIFTPSK